MKRLSSHEGHPLSSEPASVFRARFLQARWGHYPWHRRVIDIVRSYAVGVISPSPQATRSRWDLHEVLHPDSSTPWAAGYP